MRLSESLPKLAAASRRLPLPARYVAAVAITVAVFALLRLSGDLLPANYPFLGLLVAVLLSAALFDRGSGLVATGTSVLLAAYFDLPPLGSLAVDDPRDLAALGLFVAVGIAITLVLEALHLAVERLSRSERARALLLREFRHRTRNDLNGLVALLQLRARSAPSEAARDGLREAAGYAFALARVHTRLAPETAGDADDPSLADTRQFITDLCADIEAAGGCEGLRPVALHVEAEAHILPTDRAVALGLALNEALTNALKYAFPDERSGNIHVRFVRQESIYVLTVADDGVGPPPEAELDGGPPVAPPPGSGLGTRLLRGLAAQLRGSFSRLPGADGRGTVVTLRFPVRDRLQQQPGS
jgi:two-component sensor histidine kinase